MSAFPPPVETNSGLHDRLKTEGAILTDALRQLMGHYRLKILDDPDVLTCVQKEAQLLGLAVAGLVAVRIHTGTREATLLTGPGYYFSTFTRPLLVRLTKAVAREQGRVVLVRRRSLRDHIRAVAGPSVRMLPKRERRHGRVKPQWWHRRGPKPAGRKLAIGE